MTLTDSLPPDAQAAAPPARGAAAPGPCVLQVVPALNSGGVERGTIDLARHLQRIGWRPLVASSGGRMAHDLKQSGIVHIELPLAPKNPYTIWRNIARLKRVIAEHKVELVHARSRAPGWSAYYAAQATKTPFITTFHALFTGHDNRFKRRYNAIMSKGERVIAISDYVAEHLIEHYQVDPARLRVIRRGVDLTIFSPEAVSGARVAQLAERWNLLSDKKIVMLPGRVVERKGHLYLLEAMRRHKRHDYVVVFVGPFDERDPYVKMIRKTIAAHALTTRVGFTGPCDDMPAAFKLADVVVVPSLRDEAFGRVSAEAQAMGKPVIVTAVGGLPETLQPGSTGYVVSPLYPDEMVRDLDLALSMSEEVRARLLPRARRFVRDYLSLDEMCQRTVRVYQEVLYGQPVAAVVEEAAPRASIYDAPIG